MKIAISLGGSLLTGKKTDKTIHLNPKTYQKYAKTLKQLHNQGHQLIVVCGGGKPARYFIDIAKQLDATPDTQDHLGIKSTHINALLMMAALGNTADHTRIIQRGSDIKHMTPGKIWIGGGYRPKSSTDYRTVIFAKNMKADLIINATDVDGVYNKNPTQHPDAEKYRTLTYTQLEKIIKTNTRQAPGEYGLFDLKAIKLAKKENIPIIFINGTDPQEIKNAANGTHNGTTVTNQQ